MKKLFLFFFSFLCCGACGSQNDPDWGEDDKEGNDINWYAAADSSASALAKLFWNGSGQYFNYSSDGNTTFHYWPQAHGLDVWVDAYLRTGDKTYEDYFDRWFEGVKIANGHTFENDFYDDMEWNALAILRAYQATKDQKYKDAALQIWSYIKAGWNENAGGGISWKKGQEYSKNACSNGPACILAARLYQEFGNESDKEWALKIYHWEKSTLFNAGNGMVYDNINSQTGQIQKDWIFTYNEGTFIGSAVELYKIMGEKAYLMDAMLAADYTISSLVNNAVLKDEGTGDGGLFKGVFIRYFTALIQQDRLEPGAKKRYVRFLKTNAETLWMQGASKPAVLFGPDWGKSPGVSTGLTEQLSGCMLMEAMALLEKMSIL